MGGPLRLADGSKQSQIRFVRVGGSRGMDGGRALLPANSIHEQKSQPLFAFFFRWALLERAIFFPDFFPGTFAATISYDCRINSSNSSHRTASNRSSITHL